MRSFRDGWKNLRFYLLFSPNWLYLIPGLLLMVVGLIFSAMLVIGPVAIGSVVFDVGTLIYTAFAAAVGYQALLFGFLAKAYAHSAGFLPTSRVWPWLQRHGSVEVGLWLGLALLVMGVGLGIASFQRWADVGFGRLDAYQHVRVILPAALGLFFGVQTILGATFLGTMTVGHRTFTRRPDEVFIDRGH